MRHAHLRFRIKASKQVVKAIAHQGIHAIDIASNAN